MPVTAITCGKCGEPVGPAQWNLGRLAPCVACRTPIMVEAFPALLAGPLVGQRSQAVVEGTEASCFYHAAKKAVVPCDVCGRFLCALCDVEVGSRHVCPNCYDQEMSKGVAGRAQDTTVGKPIFQVDSLALMLSLLPLYITPLFALYFAISSWRRPLSVMPRTHVRHILAIFFSLVQLAFYAWSIARMVR